MKVSLLTDAPKHNLALMKLSAYHKACGDEVTLNMPIIPADYTYASVLFEKNQKAFIADEYGGPAYETKAEKGRISDNRVARNQRGRRVERPNGRRISIIPKALRQEIDIISPDYDLFDLGFSLGYTFRGCHRKCPFCKVPEIETDFVHRSIWGFHDTRFNKICLLNNNTFFDKQWRETFEEIWDANLSVIDENGYDLRLIDEEKAEYLRKTKFITKNKKGEWVAGDIHYAWDRMEDETKIIEGLKIAPKGMVYVLIGYDTTINEDFHRCQTINDMGFDPYIMPFKRTKHNRDFKRFIDTRMYRPYKTIKEAWGDYKR